MLVFAYDGSLNGDWVAHYAVRFAANTAARTLRLVHVHGRRSPSRTWTSASRASPTSARCSASRSRPSSSARRGARRRRAAARARSRSGATLIAGTRARPAEPRLPRRHRLGAPARGRSLLGHRDARRAPGRARATRAACSCRSRARPREAAHALPLLRLLGADLQRLHLLLVREVSRLRFRFLSHEGAERLLAEGRALVAPIEDELRAGLAPHRFELDSSVVVSDDAPREILLLRGQAPLAPDLPRRLPANAARAPGLRRSHRAGPARRALGRGRLPERGLTQRQIHNLEIDEVWSLLRSRPEGLRPDEVAQRLAEIGPNTLDLAAALGLAAHARQAVRQPVQPAARRVGRALLRGRPHAAGRGHGRARLGAPRRGGPERALHVRAGDPRRARDAGAAQHAAPAHHRATRRRRAGGADRGARAGRRAAALRGRSRAGRRAPGREPRSAREQRPADRRVAAREPQRGAASRRAAWSTRRTSSSPAARSCAARAPPSSTPPGGAPSSARSPRSASRCAGRRRRSSARCRAWCAS